jgi:hypothetical protein
MGFNYIKSGSTVSRGAIIKGSVNVGIDPSTDFGPSSSTGFWNGITPATSGYTVYQLKASNGPSIMTSSNDAGLSSISSSKGYTGSDVLSIWYMNTTRSLSLTNSGGTVDASSTNFNFLAAPFTATTTIPAGTYYAYNQVQNQNGVTTQNWGGGSWLIQKISSGVTTTIATMPIAAVCCFSPFNTKYLVDSLVVSNSVTFLSGDSLNVYVSVDAQGGNSFKWQYGASTLSYLKIPGQPTTQNYLNYFNGQSTMICANVNYPNIITSGLTLNVDAGYVPSYPRSGTTWTDLSGTGNTATMVNTPVFSTSNNGIFTFDGATNYFTLGTPSSLSLTSSLTISSWVKLTSFSANDTYQTIYEKGYDGTNEQIFFRFYNFSSVNYLQCGTSNSTSGTTKAEYTIGGSISTGTWYNLVAQFNGSAWIIYLNGTNVAQTNTSRGPYSSTAASSIGAAYITSSYTRFLNGSIGSIQVYNRALSSTEITTNYNAQKSIYGL